MHPPTAPVRWVSRFTVQQQFDRGRQIPGEPVAEEARVHDFTLQVVRRLVCVGAATISQRGRRARGKRGLPKAHPTKGLRVRHRTDSTCGYGMGCDEVLTGCEASSASHP